MSQKRHISLSKINTISKSTFLMFELASNTKLNSGCHLTSSNIYHIQHCILIGEGMCPQPFFFLFTYLLFIFRRRQLSGPLPILLEHGEGGGGEGIPQHSVYVLSCFPLAPTPTFTTYEYGSWPMAKQFGMKNEVLLAMSYGANWELEEHFGNLTWTHWKLNGNKLGTEKIRPFLTLTPPSLPAKTLHIMGILHLKSCVLCWCTKRPHSRTRR